MNTVTLGNLVKSKRLAEGLTIEEVSEMACTTKSTLSRIERGIGLPDVETLAWLSRWLMVPVARLIGEPARSPMRVVYIPQSPTPDIIAAHLMADPGLSAENAALLIDLFRGMYARMSQ